jgi:hypothetical protein
MLSHGLRTAFAACGSRHLQYVRTPAAPARGADIVSSRGKRERAMHNACKSIAGRAKVNELVKATTTPTSSP